MSEITDEYGPACQSSGTNDNCGVHLLSGVPNRAAALIIQKIGWANAAPLFYTVMTERLSTDSQFADYRDAVVNECVATLSEADCAVVRASFADVGL
jgi:Zn-dependent metalloprotease